MVLPSPSPPPVTFRDGLRGDPALVAASVAGKRPVPAGNPRGGAEDAERKSGFVRGVLRDLGCPGVGEGDG